MTSISSPLPRGFTLVEAVIALALTALILATLSAALFGLSQSYAKSTIRAEREEMMLLVSRALRRNLEQARPSEQQRDTPSQPALRGDNNVLEWIGYLPDSANLRGLYLWRLTMIDATDGSRQLAITLTPRHITPTLSPELPPHVLVERLTRLEINYQSMDDAVWLNHWNAHRFPALIRIEISDENSGAWPPIIVRLEP
ncbi:MAG: prepilin-type N-terminal cleavage/methylation domain-containing protein [Pseudomonadota bacterium]